MTFTERKSAIAIVEFEVRLAASAVLYSRNISEKGEKSFVDDQRLQNKLRQKLTHPIFRE